MSIMQPQKTTSRSPSAEILSTIVLYSPICLLISIGLGVIIGSCVTSEETQRRQLLLIPDGQMNAMGTQAYEEILKKEKISQDKALANFVESIGRDIASASGKDFKWEFVLIDSPKTVNAFCLPGGKVAVYTGILPVAENNAALAAVLGHEVAHAVLRHGAERMSQALAIQTGLSVAQLSLGDSKSRDLILASIGVGAQFGVLLPFSRSHESEADAVGLKYMAIAGYDPTEAPKLWDRMGKAGGRMPELLSTHPDPSRRAKDLTNSQSRVEKLYLASSKKPTQKIPF